MPTFDEPFARLDGIPPLDLERLGTMLVHQRKTGYSPHPPVGQLLEQGMRGALARAGEDGRARRALGQHAVDELVSDGPRIRRPSEPGLLWKHAISQPREKGTGCLSDDARLWEMRVGIDEPGCDDPRSDIPDRSLVLPLHAPEMAGVDDGSPGADQGSIPIPAHATVSLGCEQRPPEGPCLFAGRRHGLPL